MNPQKFFATNFNTKSPYKRITQDGIIAGGICDTALHNRAAREQGARIYLNILKQKGCLRENNGEYSIIKLPKISEEEIWKIGTEYGAHVEIGYRRFRDDVVRQLFNTKRSFRRGRLELWLDDICSFEFGSKSKDPSNALAILDALAGDKEACSFGYAPPINPALYKKRKARGDFN